MLKNVLFWEKFRPQNYKQLILLPRIKNFIKNGIETNLLLHGTMGTGKSSLARILLKNKTYKYINASLNNGVDILREELYGFCTSRQSPFNQTNDKMKYVYLDEFDKATISFQDAFKGFIEEYNNKVRFIITMNHIENVTPEIKSRFNIIDFNPKNNQEIKFLKNGYFKYLKSINNYINKHENFNINDNLIKEIINKNFPDLRSSVQNIQELFITKNTELNNFEKDYLYIHEYIMNKENSSLKNFDFVEQNFSDSSLTLLKALGRPFIKYLIDKNIDLFKSKGFQIIKLSKEHNETYNNQMIDPIIHLTNYINELKKIIN
jgi:DNA polymerase III delta prime subunit